METPAGVQSSLLTQRARPRDLPGIVALRTRNLLRYQAKGELPLSVSHDTLWRKCLEGLISPMARIEVVLDGEAVVGCLFLRLTENPLDEMKLMAVQDVFVVEPEYRGRGLGLQLLQRGQQWAKESGAETMALACHTGEGLEAWFHAHGAIPHETFCVMRLE